jgi:hypothetical protein
MPGRDASSEAGKAGSTPAAPTPANDFLGNHVRLMRDSLRRWTGRDLVPRGVTEQKAARWLYHAPFAVVSHNAEPDPVFTYGNLTALRLFEMSWEEFTRLPSRLSAEPMNQQERTRLLEQVTRHGWVDSYSGVRISARGRRFLIRNATVWNQSFQGANILNNWKKLEQGVTGR